MTGLLDDLTIIVTGGGAGIGLGVVRQCRAAGARVIVFEVDPGKAETVEKTGGVFHRVDVADPVGLSEAITAVDECYGPIYGLVNNAGITIQKPLNALSLDEMELLWQVNQRSVLVGVQAAAPLMEKAGEGSIVNIASNHARASDQGYEAYAGTKGAIVAMTRAMAWSLGPAGIRVNALAPGLTMTETVSDLAEDPARSKEFNSWHALGRVNSVDDIGKLTAFLLSRNAAAITGAEIVADQGMSARLGAI
ncbi:SDR family oxidoreductase [uncultured Roseibium sp.]|uniref:SDR family NAD(P)-dependent oxidoreductase n=1 Tax=uncultured Roseibium sp. TaxID=1936171 RepID=UPI002622F20A|nr:SDR family oxidoreductase [uncultured Roseibium sp.]